MIRSFIIGKHSRTQVILLGTIAALMLVGHTPQQAGSRDLTIIVRDMGGTPMEDVRVLLYQPGETFVDFVDERTDEDGAATFSAAPGEYLVGFAGEWRNYEFIGLAKQNAGAMTQGIYGGFAVFLDAQSTAYTFRFVVGLNDDRELVPFYDLAESADLGPVPYTYEDAEGSDEISLDTSAYRNVTLDPLLPTEVSAAAQAEQRETQRNTGSRLIDSIFLIIVLVFCAVIVILMWAVIIVQSRNTITTEDE